MMSNLFSIFDPNTSLSYQMNWFSSLLNLFLFPSLFWVINSRILNFLIFFSMKLLNELKMIMLNKFNMMNMIFFYVMFFLILLNNFMGLFPYIFTSSSHMIFSLSISLPMWLSMILFILFKNLTFFFSHLIPQGTPYILMPFMVLIETISNVIRPGTLVIRLTANMIAGHLLLTLMSSSMYSLSIYLTLLILFFQNFLMFLEFSVSIIQSYVFMILSTLYSKETN
nr:ATP synthase F0 subunit 6 [Euceros kiushuensis]